MSETLRRELMLYGLDVIVIAPGAVVTAIGTKGEAEDLNTYLATEYGPALTGFRDYFLEVLKKGFPARQLGEFTYKVFTAKNPKTRYAIVPQRFSNWTLPRLLPARVLDRLMAKRLGFSK